MKKHNIPETKNNCFDGLSRDLMANQNQIIDWINDQPLPQDTKIALKTYVKDQLGKVIDILTKFN